MVITTSPQATPPEALIAFLRHQIGLNERSLELGLRQSQLEQAPLPVVLWRFGLITLEQYAQVLDWLDRQS